jgi:hypothetical protein
MPPDIESHFLHQPIVIASPSHISDQWDIFKQISYQASRTENTKIISREDFRDRSYLAIHIFVSFQWSFL